MKSFIAPNPPSSFLDGFLSFFNFPIKCPCLVFSLLISQQFICTFYDVVHLVSLDSFHWKKCRANFHVSERLIWLINSVDFHLKRENLFEDLWLPAQFFLLLWLQFNHLALFNFRLQVLNGLQQLFQIPQLFLRINWSWRGASSLWLAEKEGDIRLQHLI